MLLLFGNTSMVRKLQHGNIPINGLTAKLSKFPPLSEIRQFGGPWPCVKMLQLQIQIQHCNLQSAMLVAPVCVPAKLEPCLATSPPLYKLHMILWTMVQLPFILPLEARVAFTPNLVPHYSTLPLSHHGVHRLPFVRGLSRNAHHS